jgi:hypothetical protein
MHRGSFLLFSGQGIIIALAVIGAAGLGGGEEAVHLILVQVHHTVIFFIFFIVIIIPAGIAFTGVHDRPPYRVSK